MLNVHSGASAGGFSLIEVLVAMLIVAVGIMGVAGLQITSLHLNQSAMFRSEALQMGNDMVDRMRANEAQDYAPTPVLLTDPPAVSLNCIAESCTPDELSGYDMAWWKCNINSTLDEALGSQFPACLSLGVAGSLPLGAGAVRKQDGFYVVTVEWQDNRAGNRRSINLRSQTAAP